MVPLDAALQQLLNISGVLFVTWFFVQLKDILVRCVCFCTMTAAPIGFRALLP